MSSTSVPGAPTGNEPQDAQALNCPNCGASYRIGELVCPNCQHVFAPGGRTIKLDNMQDIEQRKWLAGEVLVSDEKPIRLEIAGKVVPLVIKEELVLGRMHGNSPDQPDVDLNPFDAGNLGVSRIHARIRRKGILLYVIDLGSTNGTYLNGQKLIPDGERLLRDGDEVYLGRLKIRIRF